MERTTDDGADRAADGEGDATAGDRRTRSRRDVLVAGGAGLATAVAGCTGRTGTTAKTSTGQQTTPATTEEPNDKAEFRLHWQRYSNLYANVTASEHWTWPAHDVDVTVKPSNGSQAAAKSVASGKEMFGSGGYGAVLGLIGSGAPLTVVANFTGPWGGVVSLEETGITSWTDLEGKTVGQFPFGSTPVVAKAAMRRRGVDLSTIQFQNVQPGSAISLLIQGNLDAIIRYVPQTRARLGIEGYSVNALKSGAVLDHLGLALFAHDDVVDRDPDLVNDVVAGFIDGLRFWATNHDEVMARQKEIVKDSRWQPKLNDRLLGSVYAAQAPPKDVGLEQGKGWVDEDRLEKTIEVFHDAGALDTAMDPQTVYTNRFVEQNRDLAVDAAKALYAKLESFEEGPNAL
ncbi:MAG: ABC transporter substrate-binding protein [Halanaeroarchaeum sp.]